jgi:hypothetical protein
MTTSLWSKTSLEIEKGMGACQGVTVFSLMSWFTCCWRRYDKGGGVEDAMVKDETKTKVKKRGN